MASSLLPILDCCYERSVYCCGSLHTDQFILSVLTVVFSLLLLSIKEMFILTLFQSDMSKLDVFGMDEIINFLLKVCWGTITEETGNDSANDLVLSHITFYFLI